MANAHPEIGRLLDFHKSGKKDAAENAKVRAVGIVDEILGLEISLAGRTEWAQVKVMIENYENLGEFEVEILQRYAEPFAMKFMNSYMSQE